MKNYCVIVGAACVVLGNVAWAGGSFEGAAINLGVSSQSLKAETGSTAQRSYTSVPVTETPYNQSSLNKNYTAVDLDVRYGHEFFPNFILTAGLGFNAGSAKADYSQTNVTPYTNSINNAPLGIGGDEYTQYNTTRSSVKAGNMWNFYVAPGYRVNFNQSALGSDWLPYVKLGVHRSSYEFTRSGVFEEFSSTNVPVGRPASNPENKVKKNVNGFLWGLGLAKEFSHSDNLFLRHLNIGLEWRRLEQNYNTGGYQVFYKDNGGFYYASSTVAIKLKPLDMYVFSVGFRF